MSEQRLILTLFDDEQTNLKIQRKLPLLFGLAEAQVMRGGKVGMEAGVLREKVLIALLIYKYSKDKVNYNISTTESETDVQVDGHCVSIKTVTLQSPTTIPTVKVSWTVDAQSADDFVKKYKPKCDILLAVICRDKSVQQSEQSNASQRGLGLYIIPIEVQLKVLQALGHDKYLKKPKQGTNPRGIEFSKEAMRNILFHGDTKYLPISWVLPRSYEELQERSYEQWVELWCKDEDDL